MPRLSLSLDAQQRPDHLTNLILVVFGIFVWEYVNTLRVECNIKASFHWSDVVYLVCRYSFLLFVFGLVLCVASNPGANINRIAVLNMISWSEVFVIAAGTTVLVLRVAAVWKERKHVLFPLLFVAVAHWIVLCSTLPYRKLWSGASMSGFNDLYCSSTLIQVSTIFTTVFHVTLFVGVIIGQRIWGRRNLPLRVILKDDGVYFALVLIAGAADLVLTCICAAREVHQGLRIAACATIGITACRFFRRFDQHHRSRIAEETAPIVAATRRLANRPSKTLLSLRRASEGVLLPAKEGTVHSAAISEHDRRAYDSSESSGVTVSVQTLPKALSPRSPYVNLV